MSSSDDIKRSGYATVGEIEQSLIRDLKRYVDAPVIEQRHARQTYLKWNSDCEAVLTYFETVSQSRIRRALTHCANHRGST